MLPLLTPSDFVALVNQTFDFAFPIVEIQGEVTNYKVSKNRWVYFDIADDNTKIRCFGTVYMLPGPVEDGMVVRITASPKLHQQFGFSLNLQSLQFSGEGTIKKASDLLASQLDKEGLFAEERKRILPYPPTKIALVTSAESAAYKDFVKVLSARQGGINIELADITVQGESSPAQIVRAIEWFNKVAEIADVLVIIRGGGSADDLQAFSSEQVVRAVAASRIPTMVAIGHEVDISLAELAADKRASTPSNAAELLVPDRKDILIRLKQDFATLQKYTNGLLENQANINIENAKFLRNVSAEPLQKFETKLNQSLRTLKALSPQAILERGYSIVRQNQKVVKSSKKLNGVVQIQFSDGNVGAEVQ